MLIKAQNGLSLYDTTSGTSIKILPTSVNSIWVIQGADGTNIGTYGTKEDAAYALGKIFEAAAREMTAWSMRWETEA